MSVDTISMECDAFASSGLVETHDAFKATEIGAIPVEWDVVAIGDIADVKTGPFGSALHERDYVAEGTPIITVEHLGEHGVVHSNLPLVSDSDRIRLCGYQLRAGDLVFSRVGSVDRNALIRPPEDGWLFSGRLLRVRCRDARAHPPYLSYHFHSEPFKLRVRTVAVGQTMASLNTQILKAVLVVLPPPEEQGAIAEVLSDVDRLIESLDALIAKKRAIKQATMQQLLTGKTRLPGFEGEWIEKPMDDLVQVDPENLRSSTQGEYRFNYISLEQVDVGMLLGWTEERFATAPSRARRILRHEDVLMSTVRPNLMAHLHYVSQIPNAVCSTGFAVLRSKLSCAVPGYVFAHLFADGVNKQIEKTLAGSNYPAINGRDVRLISIPCPPDVDEQAAIAKVLSDMDAEIAALQHRRDKTKKIKQGMMQQLLTGRIRLVSPPEAETPC